MAELVAADLAARIDRLRCELDCTQAELAWVLEVKPGTLSAYKRCLRPWPEWVLLRMGIAEVCVGLDPVRDHLITLSLMNTRAKEIAKETVTRTRRLLRLTDLRRKYANEC